MRRPLFLLALMVSLAPPLMAIRPDAPASLRVGVLRPPPPIGPGSVATGILPKYLHDELRRAGIDSRLMRQTLEDLRRSDLLEGDAFYVEVVCLDAGGDQLGSITGGGQVGGTNVGAELSVVVADVHAEVRLYDARTLERVDAFQLHASSASPELTGIGLGDDHVGIFLPIPYFRNAVFRRASHDIAHNAAGRLAGRMRAAQ